MSTPKCWPTNAEEMFDFPSEDGWVALPNDGEFFDGVDELNKTLAKYGAKLECYMEDGAEGVVMRVLGIE